MPGNVEISGRAEGRVADVLSEEALAFVAELHERFDPVRRALLRERAERQAAVDAGDPLRFPEETAEVRAGDWTVEPVPEDLQDRRVEITGPVDRKMMINALNSGAKVFMADFEDSLSPTWENVAEGQLNLIDANQRTLAFVKDDGTEYRLGDEVATLMVRPRGWHLVERHVLVDGEPVSASLLDFGLYFFHNARRRLDDGKGTYLYLPKLESHLEARLWNDVFTYSEERLGVPRGTVKATVLIETIWAAMEMEEILYELREHSAGLNAGRWDYIFSCIKTFRNEEGLTFPDRGQVTMTVPFMRAYTERLVHVCHKRGAHAMGGMAAFIPNRRDEDVTRRALAKVTEDKEREATDGCDGTWVAHPDLVPVAMQVFDKVLGDHPNQIDRKRPDVDVAAEALTDFDVPGGTITEEGLRVNVSVGIRYIESWLRGNGAAAIDNLMEDAATAEISRSQVWQWVQRGASLENGRTVTAELVREAIDEELDALRERFGAELYDSGRFPEARALFEEVALADDFPDFLTLPAYDKLEPPEDRT